MAEHLTLLTMLFIVPHVKHLEIVNLICFASLAACPVVLLSAKSAYRRMDAEDRGGGSVSNAIND
jgi:hypothetical protein